MSAAARIEALTARHGDRVVLDDVSLDVDPGRIVSVLGPSGSGKTTLLRVVAGLHRAHAGAVVIAGEDVTGRAPERRRVGLVPQDAALFGHLSVAANVAYGIRGLRASRAREDPRVRELLALVGLEQEAARMPHQLSGGQQQRVALARALAPRPALVLLDEPFSALDAGLRQRLRDDVADIVRSQGVGAILVTHDQDEALSMSDGLIVLRDGLVVQRGAPADVYARPADAWTARFLGDAMIVDVRMVGGVAVSPLGPVAVDHEEPTGDAGAAAHDADVGTLAPTGSFRAVVRPEQLRIAPDDGSGIVCERVSFFGHDVLAYLSLPDGTTARARVPSRDAPARGDRVAVRVDGVVSLLPSSP